MFITGPVSFPGVNVIEAGVDGTKDFSVLIDKALELGGWEDDRSFAGINDGTSITTGFGCDTVMTVAPAVIEAVKSGVNDLPLPMVLSWYEQKAICILLALLYLGIKGIYLGPTLPAFVSLGVLQVLVDSYGIRPISTPEADLAQIMG